MSSQEHDAKNTNGATRSSSTSLSATQRVFHQLRRQIIEGTIAPGERLKVESLKVTLDTGTAPIREALSLLTSDLLVERIDQRGFRAAPASLEHFQEILNLRCQLESIALRDSVLNGDTVWEEALVLKHHRMMQALNIDAEEFERRHKAFHRALISAAGSPILLKFCDQLYDLNIRYRFLAGRSAHYDQRDVTGEHKDILEAALARNDELASRNLVEHYKVTGEFLVDQLNTALQTQSA